jgi:hypothetical protein
VLPFTVGIRDSAVQLVSTLGSVVILPRRRGGGTHHAALHDGAAQHVHLRVLRLHALRQKLSLRAAAQSNAKRSESCPRANS